MINFSVINLRNLIKNALKFALVLALILGIMNVGDLIIVQSKNFSFLELTKVSLGIKETTNESSISKESFFQKLIASELPILANSNSVDLSTSALSSSEAEETPENTSLENIATEETITSSENVSQVESTSLENQENLNTTESVSTETSNLSSFENLQTEVISSNNLSESFNLTYGTVKIKNETSFTLDDNILTPNVSYTNKTDILIFHTHTCESYTPTEASTYTASGNFRTTDLTHSVAQVGTILSNELLRYNYNIIHSLEYHDYPAYNGSYSRSLTTVSNLLKQNSPELVIDLHRDAVGSMSSYAPSIKIGDETVAQLMFVIGTNGGGLSHDNWQTNLKFAIKIQEKANKLFPGLFRPIIIRNSRYNQHLTTSSVIIEVGATGNTLEQATRKYEIFSICNKCCNARKLNSFISTVKSFFCKHHHSNCITYPIISIKIR